MDVKIITKMELLWKSIASQDFETVNIYANSRVEYNDGINEMLNDNFGFRNVDSSDKVAIPLGWEDFSNVDDSNTDVISLGWERMTQMQKTITSY